MEDCAITDCTKTIYNDSLFCKRHHIMTRHIIYGKHTHIATPECGCPCDWSKRTKIIVRLLKMIPPDRRMDLIIEQLNKEGLDERQLELIFECCAVNIDYEATLNCAEERVEKGLINEQGYLYYAEFAKLVYEMQTKTAE